MCLDEMLTMKLAYLSFSLAVIMTVFGLVILSEQVYQARDDLMGKALEQSAQCSSIKETFEYVLNLLILGSMHEKT